MEFEPPKRHGCLTAYLVFMMIVNTLACLSYLLMGGRMLAQYPSAPPGIAYVLAIGCAINVTIALLLFWWQKWAFYVFCAMAVIVLGLNIWIGINPVMALAGLVGPVVLWAVFQIGGEQKGWKYLK
jgi:hypothetical protein